MRVSIRQWGNSAAVRIPSAVLEAASLVIDEPVEIHEEDGRIVIEPLRRKKYDLETLIAGITDENRHREIDTGPAVGKELL